MLSVERTTERHQQQTPKANLKDTRQRFEESP